MADEVKTADAGPETTTAPETKKTKKASKSPIDDIMTLIKGLSVLELVDLVKTLETEFGVSAAVPMVAAAGAPAAATEAAAPVEEKMEFNVILKAVGANKINVIRVVRELTSLGLKESKDLVESAPKPVKEAVSKEDAATAKKKLEDAGATVEVT